jgi:long-chain acyl-CoA synthetase
MHLGIWREVSWQDYRQTVEEVALGMLELGVQEGDRVAMMGDPTPEWLYLDTAAMSVGAIFYGIYVNQSPSEMKYLLEDGAPTLYMAQDQEYVDKLLDAESGGSKLVNHVIVADMRGMFQYKDPRLLSFVDLHALGIQRKATRPTEWRDHVQRRKPDDIIRISYTSGTTGRPKGAMLSSRNLVWATSALYRSINIHPGPNDRTVSYMPPASPAEVTFSLILPALFGTVPHIPDDLDARGDAFVEVSPTLLLAFPRMWETYASRALVDIDTGRRLKRFAYKIAFAISRRYYDSLWAGSMPGLLSRLGRFIAYWCVFEHLLNKYGLARTRFVMTGGAPVSPDLLRLWNTWGVGVQEIYGMTEVSGLATVQMDGKPMPGIAGKALYGMEVRLAADGEILLKSPGVFHGYWKKDGATRDVIDAEGWLHTGDIGRLLPDGNLKVVDRRSDLIETSDGRQIPASEIEHLLKGSPYIREAILTGDKKDFLTALIEIDVEAVTEWARGHHVLYTSFSSLITTEEIHRLIKGVVDAVNVNLREAGRPELRDFRILPKELDPEEGDEVTSTNKVRRRLLAKKFSVLLDEMYDLSPRDVVDASR